MDWDDYDSNVSATQTFLKYLEYPEDAETPIDLQQTAVVVMSHLDRLTIPHLPQVPSNSSVSFRLFVMLSLKGKMAI